MCRVDSFLCLVWDLGQVVLVFGLRGCLSQSSDHLRLRRTIRLEWFGELCVGRCRVSTGPFRLRLRSEVIAVGCCCCAIRLLPQHFAIDGLVASALHCCRLNCLLGVDCFANLVVARSCLAIAMSCRIAAKFGRRNCVVIASASVASDFVLEDRLCVCSLLGRNSMERAGPKLFVQWMMPWLRL